MDEKRIKILSDAPVLSAIFKLSMPVIAGMIVQILYNLVDTFYIGQLNDPNQLAAANLSTPIFMVIMALAGIIGTGGASYISRALGRKDFKSANKAFCISVGICISIGALVTVLGLIFSSQVAVMLGASENTFPYVYQYIFIIFIGSIPGVLGFSLGQLMRSEGAATLSMIGMLIGTVTNIILDPIFIFTLNMGMRGAAIATVIGNFAAALFYFLCFFRKKTLLHFSHKIFIFDKSIYKEIFAIGVPASLNQILMSVAIVFSNNIAASYGDLVVAGMGVAAKVFTIGIFIFMGFAAGCQPLVGYSYGAKNFARVKSVIKTGAGITASFGVVLLIIFGFFAPFIIRIFSNVDQVVEVGTYILRAQMLSLPFIGAIMLCITTIQSMGKALPALFLSISRQGIIFLPLLFLLNGLFGYNGFVYAQPITDFLIFVIAAIVLLQILKNDHNLHEKSLQENSQGLKTNTV